MIELLGELRDLLQERSIQRGSFTLASGQQASYYCDTKATLLSPEGARLVGEVLFHLLAERKVEAVGGLAMGAAFIAPAVALVSGLHCSPMYGFTVREQRKEHGLRRVVEQSFHPDGRPLLCQGRRVAVVDDVVTEGGSILRAVDEVQQAGCQIEAVISIVDRQAGGGDKLRSQGLPYLSLFTTDEAGTLAINEQLLEADSPQLAARAASV